MKRALFAAIVAVTVAAGVTAQARPDFSGTWVLDTEKSVMGRMGGGRGGAGMAALTIATSGSTLTATREGMNGPVSTVYKLDGAESKNMQMGRGGSAEAIYRSRWDGEKLVTTITGGMGTATETRWLDSDGSMVVETTRPGRGGTPMTMKLVYRKKG